MDGLKIGMSVKIHNRRYSDLTDITYGTIKEINDCWVNGIAVSIYNHKNPRSSKGFYYFDTDDLEENTDCVANVYPRTMINGLYGISPCDAGIRAYSCSPLETKYMEDNKMKNKQLIKGYKVAKIAFEGCDNLINYALYEDDVMIDDKVLCSTGHHGEQIGKVAGIYDLTDEHMPDMPVNYGREVICKIDYSGYINRQERLHKLAQLKQKMEKKREELNELAVYQALAADCPEMAEMLKEFKELL